MKNIKLKTALFIIIAVILIPFAAHAQDPSPFVTCDHSELTMNAGDSVKLTFTVQNNGGTVNKAYFTVTVSNNLEVITKEPDSLWWRYEIGDTISYWTDEMVPSLVSEYLVHDMYEFTYGTGERTYSLTVKCLNADTGWVKYRIAMNPEGVESHNYNPDTFFRYPSSGEPDQQGWAAAAIPLNASATGIGEIHNMPDKFSLKQNYPNPFNPVTEIKYNLPRAEYVLLNIYDLLGRKIRTLGSGHLPSGYHSVTWNGTNDAGIPVSSGVYIYRMQAGRFTQSRKMVLVR